MHILLCCGEQGLLEHRNGWRRLPCPLARPALAAASGGVMAAVDTVNGELWAMGRIIPVDPGAEALLLDPAHALVLSGETDCLTLLDLATGQPLLTSPVGVYPQDMCLLSGRLAAVCGGADGAVRLMDPQQLETLRLIPLPGQTQRLAWSGGVLYVLCADCDGMLCCVLWRILRNGHPLRVLQLPGLPGALCADGRGGVWAASS